MRITLFSQFIGQNFNIQSKPITMKFILRLFFFLSSPLLYGQSPPDNNEEELFFKYQTLKGVWHVSGNFGLGLGFRNKSLSLNNSTVVVDVSTNPKIGVFLFERWQTGLSYDYHASVTSFGEKNDYGVFSSVVGAYVRHYHPRGFFGEVQYGIGGGRERIRNGINDQIVSYGIRTHRYTLGIGLASFWTKRIHFEILLRYSRAMNRNTTTNERFNASRLGILGGLSIVIGK